jgi:hypothetical protein
MNKENFELLLVALRDANKNDEHRENFTMLSFGHICGTPACVLGHLAHRRDLQSVFFLEDMELIDVVTDGYVQLETLLEFFDIGKNEYYRLFGPYGCGDAVSLKGAIEYIENFIKDELVP